MEITIKVITHLLCFPWCTYLYIRPFYSWIVGWAITWKQKMKIKIHELYAIIKPKQRIYSVFLLFKGFVAWLFDFGWTETILFRSLCSVVTRIAHVTPGRPGNKVTIERDSATFGLTSCLTPFTTRLFNYQNTPSARAPLSLSCKAPTTRGKVWLRVWTRRRVLR